MCSAADPVRVCSGSLSLITFPAQRPFPLASHITQVHANVSARLQHCARIGQHRVTKTVVAPAGVGGATDALFGSAIETSLGFDISFSVMASLGAGFCFSMNTFAVDANALGPIDESRVELLFPASGGAAARREGHAFFDNPQFRLSPDWQFFHLSFDGATQTLSVWVLPTADDDSTDPLFSAVVPEFDGRRPVFPSFSGLGLDVLVRVDVFVDGAAAAGHQARGDDVLYDRLTGVM